MKNNGLSTKFKKSNRTYKQVSNPKIVTNNHAKPIISKVNSVISSKDINCKPYINQSVSSSQKEITSKLSNKKNIMKLNIEVKQIPIDNLTINEDKDKNRIAELEAELAMLNDDDKALKIVQSKLELQNINYKRDEENYSNVICIKSNNLNKIKKTNVNLKEKLEQLNKELSEMNDAPIMTNETVQNNTPDDNVFHLMANYEAHKEQEEEENHYIPLSYDVIQKIPIHSYNNHTNENEKCYLCDFELCKNDVIMEIPSCQHIFHKECLLRFCERHNFCPSCKEEINI